MSAAYVHCRQGVKEAEFVEILGQHVLALSHAGPHNLQALEAWERREADAGHHAVTVAKLQPGQRSQCPGFSWWELLDPVAAIKPQLLSL